MADVIDAAAFCKLHKNEERRAALDGIIEHLSPYEWRALSQKLASRTFQHDIIGLLPVELVIPIFKLLPWNHSFVCRRVSKGWAHVLSSPEFKRAALTGWIPNPDTLSSAEIRAYKQRLCAFRSGKPVAYSTYDIELVLFPRSSSPTSLRTFALQDEFTAWIDGREYSNQLKAMNLRTGDRRIFKTPDRSPLRAMTLSKKLVAAITYNGMCYMLSLDTNQQKAFKLPSAQIKAITARDGMVAVLISGKTFTVVCHDFNKGKTRSFAFEVPFTDHVPAALLLQPERGSIVVFSANTKDLIDEATWIPDSFNIACSRYSYSGQTLSAHLIMPPKHYQLNAWTAARIGDVHQIDCDGNYHVWPNPLNSNIQTPLPSSALCPRYSVVYNEKQDKLLHVSKVDIDNRSVLSYSSWKDTEYQYKCEYTGMRNGVIGVSKFDANSGFPKVHIMPGQQRMLGLTDETHDSELDRKRTTVLVNDHYLVAFRPKSLHVWCFDRNAPLPTGSLSIYGRPNAPHWYE